MPDGWVKKVVCIDCGQSRYVRKDSNPLRCKHCSSSIGGKAPKPRRAEFVTFNCMYCGKLNERYKKQINARNFCNKDCYKKFNEMKKVLRQCKNCKSEFYVQKSRLTGKTNSSGNFCCRKCYNEWLCDTKRTRNYGSRWKSIRDSVISNFPFCALCGTTKNLQVHHIVPYRITKDNGLDNLIPLCVKHHKVIENITLELVNAGCKEDIKRYFGTNLRQFQEIVLTKVRRMVCGHC